MKLALAGKILASFLSELAQIIFVPFLIFLVASCRGRRYFRAQRLALVLLVMLAGMLLLRMTYFIFGIPSARYLLPTVPLFILLGTPGFLVCCQWIRRYCPRPWGRKYLPAIGIILVTLCCIGKSLHFRDAKSYIQQVGDDLAHHTTGRAVTFITNIDSRPSRLRVGETKVIEIPQLQWEQLLRICRHEQAAQRQIFLFLQNYPQAVKEMQLKIIGRYDFRAKHYILYVYQPLKQGKININNRAQMNIAP